jgi:pimeloyl-ACP methyl ester carboxylesterase
MRQPHWKRWAGVLIAGVLFATLAAPVPASAAFATSAPTTGQPRLADPHPCFTDFTCAYLTVPLDRTGQVPGTLRLRVAMANNATAPRGSLLFLTGGPGQPGAGLVPSISQRVDYLLDDYRLIMIDQRGTGEGAIDCPRLQVEAGASDITPPSPQAVRECASLLGPTRHFYTTADTVADLEDLRRALDVPRWTIDGISYGAYVGTHYGLTYPKRVSRLVLDSVVPQDNVHSLYVDSLRRTATVLRTACQEQNCSHDPAAELAEVVRRDGNGVGVFDLMVVASILDPKLTGTTFFPMLELLHQSAQGNPDPLNQAIEFLRSVGIQVPPEEFSSGLHVATICADLTDAPWGDSAAPLSGRDEAVDRALRKLHPSETWPFPPETAIGHGFIQSCRHWPPSRPNPQPPRPRLTMPVLLINGDRDLSTPLEWAKEQAALTPRGKLVVIPGMGHSIQGRNAAGDAAVSSFLLGGSPRRP